MNQPKLQNLKLTTYFNRYFFLICLSLLLFNCDTDETILLQEENLLENKFKIPSVSITQNNFELSTQIRNPFKSTSSSSSELFRANSEPENEIFVNWDKSVAKNFKEEDGGVDILYTPVEYNSNNVRMKTFIASVENESEVESSIITVVYDDTSNEYQFSGLIIKHYLNGDLKQIYKYENGIRILESVEYDSYIEDNQAETETTSIATGEELFTEYPEEDTDCSMTLYDLLMALWESGGGYYAFDTVVVVGYSNGDDTSEGSEGSDGTDGGWGWDGDGFDWENPDDILTEGGGGSSGGGGGSSDGSNNDNTDETSDEVEPEWWEDCGVGYVLDADGNCVQVMPCDGDPVTSPEIAPQLGVSGTKGALHGCTRYGGSCTSTDGRTKSHAGIDLKSNFGDPIYAMYSGFIYSTKYQKNGAGYYTRIQSTVNGNTFLVEYFHMQQNNRILQNTPGNPLVYVNAGDIIGYQGDSGNLKGAIAAGTVGSHVHIEVREHDGTTSWGYNNFNPVDPRSYLSTTIDDNGVSQSNTNCN